MQPHSHCEPLMKRIDPAGIFLPHESNLVSAAREVKVDFSKPSGAALLQKFHEMTRRRERPRDFPPVKRDRADRSADDQAPL